MECHQNDTAYSRDLAASDQRIAHGFLDNRGENEHHRRVIEQTLITGILWMHEQ